MNFVSTSRRRQTQPQDTQPAHDHWSGKRPEQIHQGQVQDAEVIDGDKKYLPEREEE